MLIVGFDSVSAAEIATFYGFEDFTTLDDYISSHLYLVPFTRHFTQASLPKHDRPISAIFMVHEPVYWAEGLQVLCDVLLSADGVIKPEGYTMGKEQTIPFFVANPDFVYPASFAVPRFTSGAFSSCLADLYKGHTGKNLNVTYYGKPIASIYTYAKEVLEKQANQELQRIYCIGDNPLSDIKGANEAPGPEGFWFSMLVTTGCWKGEIHENDPQNPAKFVSNDVLEAVQFILKQ